MAWFNSLPGKRRRLAALAPRERGLLLRALMLLPLVSAARRLLPVRIVQALLERLLPLRPGAAAYGPEAQRIAWLVEAAARHGPLRANCLERSLVLAALLRRQGIVSQVTMGVRRSDAGFEAHAWVECHGQVINDAPDVRSRYVVFTGNAQPP